MAGETKRLGRLVLTLDKYNAVKLTAGAAAAIVRLAPKQSRTRVVIEAPEDVKVTRVGVEVQTKGHEE